MSQLTTRAEHFFWKLTNHPLLTLVAGIVGIIAAATFVPGLVKDTSLDAFIAADNPAIIYRDKAREVFGLSDPFVIAVIDKQPQGIYNAAVLSLVKTLTESVQTLDNIDPDRVTSLFTESNIMGTADGMEVDDFYELGETGLPDALAIRTAIDDFPLYQGSLVAKDNSATLIVAEMLDDKKGQETYDTFMALVKDTPIPDSVEVHVAGEGAIAGYLGTYIDNDATRLNPLSALVITLVLIVAFRTVAGAILPNIIVAATAVAAFALMAGSGVPFFVITNGLLPILIGIAVADSIHILSEYYELAARHPDWLPRTLIVKAMTNMWRPVTLTTVTTIAGFAGLWIGAEMPPMKYFGLFASIGVAAAWLYSIFFLPAAITLFNINPSKAFAPTLDVDVYGRVMSRFGRLVLAYPKTIIGIVASIAIVGAIGASQVVVEESQIENFQSDEPIYLADHAINDALDGTNYLDVVIETPGREELFKPENLYKIEALQVYAETLPGVQGSTSVVDYIKQMHKAVNENRQAFYSIPDDEFLIAQLFLLYSTSGDPTDFEEEVDYDYQRANVRLNLNTSFYRNNREVVEDLQLYIDREFNDDEITANLSGRVFVNHQFLKTIGENHLRSLLISVLLVWLMASFVFRSLVAGAFALIPVVMSLLLIYAVMGFTGVWLGIGTSMFAAIALGLGVDFSIHTIDKMKELIMTHTGTFDERIAPYFVSTGRALFFNFAAIALGFLVLVISEVPALIKFGILVVIAISAAFVASVAALPVLIKLLKPAFIWTGEEAELDPGLSPAITATRVGIISLLVLIVGSVSFSGPSRADSLPEGQGIIQNVVDRDEGEWVTRKLRMEMTDRRGTTRTRETDAYRRYYGEEKRTVIFYNSPTNVKGTGFLTYDYPEADRDDDQWLYLPALRKVRRISASDRGDYFLGTDFSFEDIKKESKIGMEDYIFKTLGQEDIDGHPTYVIEALPINKNIALELGYSRVLLHVDPEIWISRKTQMWDVSGNPLKILRSQDIRQIDGIWSVHSISAENHKTGHKTQFTFSDIDYRKEVKDKVFKTNTLKRGF